MLCKNNIKAFMLKQDCVNEQACTGIDTNKKN